MNVAPAQMASRRCQPFGVEPIGTRIQVAPVALLPGGSIGASSLSFTLALDAWESVLAHVEKRSRESVGDVRKIVGEIRSVEC